MLVLSHFYLPSAAARANHASYAARFGYRHLIRDVSDSCSSMALKWLHRYETLLHTLTRCAEGEWVLMLSEDAVIFEHVSIEHMTQGRTHLLVRTDHPTLPQVDVQWWQNTAANREQVLAIIKRYRLNGDDPPESEAHVLSGLPTQGCLEPVVDNILAVSPAGAIRELPNWSHRMFALSIDERSHHPTEKRSIPRYREVFIDHINRWQAGRGPLLEWPEYDDWVPEGLPEREGFHTGHPIALTTLYTPNIRSYARMAERNFVAYAKRHGYALYLHRDIPAEVGLNATGNWFKPWILHAYLQHHEWVIWLDADVLFGQIDQPLEPLLQGRDRLLAHDLGQWPFNSGVMAFRRTPQNLAFLEELMRRIGQLGGLKDVYAHDGDQMQFLKLSQDWGLLQDDELSTLIDWNCPWPFKGPDSLTIHYYFMWPQMRALMMAHDNEDILRGGEAES